MLLRFGRGMTPSFSNALSDSAGSPYLDGVVDNVLMDLDATISDSYSGSGSTWINLTGDTTYDMPMVGTPVFNGTAGDAGAYWTFSNNNFFQISSNTSFINAMHKTTGGTDWTVITVLRSMDDTWTNTERFWTTMAGSGPGLRATSVSSEIFRIIQYGDTGNDHEGHFVSGPGDFVVIASYDSAAAQTTFYVNTSTGNVGDHVFNATTSDAAGKLSIGAQSDGNNALTSANFRIYAFAMRDAVTSSSEAAAILAHYEARHTRDYTS